MTEATEVAVVEEQSTDMALIEEQMAAMAAQMQENLKVTTNRISTRNKQFTMPDGTVAGQTLDLTILGYAYVNSLYEGAFDMNNPKGPICYAKNMSEDQLKPSKNVESPECDSCFDCPNNQWGSAPTGKGKACKNELHLAVIAPDYSSEPAILSISPTGMKNVTTFLSGLIKHYGHPARAIVTAEFTTDAFPVVCFKGGGKPNEQAALHFSKAADAMDNLLNS